MTENRKEARENNQSLEGFNNVEVKARVNTSINSEIVKVAKSQNWKWDDLIEFAVKFKLAEEYPQYEYPECELNRKLKKAVSQLNEKCQEVEHLKSQLQGSGEQEGQEVQETGQIHDSKADEILGK